MHMALLLCSHTMVSAPCRINSLVTRCQSNASYEPSGQQLAHVGACTQYIYFDATTSVTAAISVFCFRCLPFENGSAEGGDVQELTTDIYVRPVGTAVTAYVAD